MKAPNHHTLAEDPRALSIRNPWPDAIFWNDPGSKTIENRTKWTEQHPGATFRGEVFIHAPARKSVPNEVEWFRDVDLWRIGRTRWQIPQMDALRYGGIVGRAVIIGFVRPPGIVTIDTLPEPLVRELLPHERVWWMGGFAFLLSRARRTPFVPLAGMLGFFRVPAEKVAEALR